jgi:hypothetical protein
MPVIYYILNRSRWAQGLIFVIFFVLQLKFQYGLFLEDSYSCYRKSVMDCRQKNRKLRLIKRELSRIKEKMILGEARCGLENPKKTATVAAILNDSMLQVKKIDLSNGNCVQVLAETGFEEWVEFLRSCSKTQNITINDFLVQKTTQNLLLVVFKLRVA